MTTSEDIPESWSREDVVQRVARDFPLEQREEVLTTLDQYPGDTPGGRARVQLAVLSAAGGDLMKVRAYVAHANIDFRDVLYWAERGS